MKILAIDIGTGTQDIFLFDSQLDLENGYKMVLPSPTLRINHQLHKATKQQRPVVLTGVIMGGGPSSWAIEAHLRAGQVVYAVTSAARTLDDDLETVQAMGIKLVSEDEVLRLPESVLRIDLRDFDYAAITYVLNEFNVSLDQLSALAVAVFDHGAAPPGVSDRQFRFDYLDKRIRAENRLSAFAYRSEDIPTSMTRLQAVAQSAPDLPVPLVVMDTAPAAVLGATLDQAMASEARVIITNIGNFHTLAFRLGPVGIEGVFEHHTGEIDQPRLEALLCSLADGTIQHADVFEQHGHGALIYSHEAHTFNNKDLNLIVTGPQRNMLRQSSLKPYFPAPFGDMMITGCFGLLAATADILPELGETIRLSLSGKGKSGTAPWDV
jgi:uncharacterized protein (DUF1786 family)